MRPDPIAKEGLVRTHLKKYWSAETAQTTKSSIIALNKFVEVQVSSGHPPYELDLASVLIFPERQRSVVVEGRGEILAKYKANKVKKGRRIPESHIASFSGAFSKFRRIS